MTSSVSTATATTTRHDSGKPKLCLFMNSYVFGGVEQHVILLCQQLSGFGYEPIVVSTEVDALGKLYVQLDRMGIRHIPFNPKSGVAGKTRAVFELRQIFKRENIALVHLQLIFTDGGRIP